jgi:hypothetical protein
LIVKRGSEGLILADAFRQSLYERFFFPTRFEGVIRDRVRKAPPIDFEHNFLESLHHVAYLAVRDVILSKDVRNMKRFLSEDYFQPVSFDDHPQSSQQC